MKNLAQQHRDEVICLLLLGATAVALLVGSAALPEPMFDPLGPAGMPRNIGYLLVALLVLRVFVLLRESKSEAQQEAEPSLEARHDGKPLGAGERGIPRPEVVDALQIGRLVLASAIALAYLIALTVGGFPFTVATMVFLAAFGASMTDLTPRKLIIVAAIAIVMSFVLTYVFSDILSVILPE